MGQKTRRPYHAQSETGAIEQRCAVFHDASSGASLRQEGFSAPIPLAAPAGQCQ